MEVFECFLLQKIRPLRRLLTICSGGNYTSTGADVCTRFRQVVTRLTPLETNGFPSSSLGQNPLDPPLSTFNTDIAALRAELVVTRLDLKHLISSLDQKSISIGGIRF